MQDHGIRVLGRYEVKGWMNEWHGRGDKCTYITCSKYPCAEGGGETGLIRRRRRLSKRPSQEPRSRQLGACMAWWCVVRGAWCVVCGACTVLCRTTQTDEPILINLNLPLGESLEVPVSHFFFVKWKRNGPFNKPHQGSPGKSRGFKKEWALLKRHKRGPCGVKSDKSGNRWRHNVCECRRIGDRLGICHYSCPVAVDSCVPQDQCSHLCGTGLLYDVV